MRLLSRNRRPVADDPIMYEGIPYRRLSGPDARGRVEAVDPWGNQAIFAHKDGRYFMQQPDYISKRSLEGIRKIHPDIADRLDTDYGDPYKIDGFNVWDNRLFYIDSNWFNRTRSYVETGDGKYSLLSEERSVESGVVFVDYRRRYHDMGVEEEQFYGDGIDRGFRYTYYDERARKWIVDEWVSGDDINDYMRSPAPPFNKPKSRPKNGAVSSCNRRGRGRR